MPQAPFYLSMRHTPLVSLASTDGGLADKLALTTKIDLHLGTLSKAVGLSGGYVCANRAAIDVILNRARSFIYSTAPPPAIAAAAHDVITRILPGAMGERRRTQLWRNVRQFESCMAEAGHPLQEEPASAIVPIILGESKRAIAISEKLNQAGFLIPAIRYPYRPRQSSKAACHSLRQPQRRGNRRTL